MLLKFPDLYEYTLTCQILTSVSLSKYLVRRKQPFVLGLLAIMKYSSCHFVAVWFLSTRRGAYWRRRQFWRRCHQLSSDFGRAKLTDKVANRIRKQLICRHSAGFCGMAQLHFGKERATFCSLVVVAVRLRSFQISKVKFTHY
jgi:hypothetical protein